MQRAPQEGGTPHHVSFGSIPPKLVAVLIHEWRGYAIALLAVVALSVLIGFVLGRFRIANVSMLYLIAVLVAAVWGGRGPAVVASVLAFLAFNWFFVEPLHTFTVSDPEEWVALLLFLLTAVVAGQLAAALRERAREAVQRQQEAEHRERESVVLYDVVRLLAEAELDHALDSVAQRVQRELDVAAVGIQLLAPGDEPRQIAVGDDPAVLQLVRSQLAAPSHLLGAGVAPSGALRGAPGRWVRLVRPHPPGAELMSSQGRLVTVPVKVGERRIGALLLVHRKSRGVFSPPDDRLLSTVASQVAAAVERQRLRREATEAEVLRRTDELKTALLNAVSHDLRTPLATIIAAADSLCQCDVAWSDEDRVAFARDIANEARRLGRLVGNLLDLSRIEAGQLRPQRAWHDLGGLVSEVLQRLEHLTADHPIVIDVPDDLPPLLLDYVEVDQVLTNLIENAVKYTPRGTEIRVSASQSDGVAQVEVADRGPGVPADALGRVFDRFYRVDGGAPRATGIGLGLAVAQRLVEAHGGRIWAENRPGGGARFVFTLPVDQTSGEVEATAPQTGHGP